MQTERYQTLGSGSMILRCHSYVAGSNPFRRSTEPTSVQAMGCVVVGSLPKGHVAYSIAGPSNIEKRR